MQRFWAFIISLSLLGCSNGADRKAACVSPFQVASPTKLGVEVLFDKHLDLLRGKRVALITNPTGVNRYLESTINLFKAHPEVKLVALLGPEHGVHSSAQAGEFVAHYVDPDYQVPVYSLYGAKQKNPEEKLANIDEAMRAFDTQTTDKTLDPSLLKNVDVVVFDLQDVGTRIYTYVATMVFAMQGCAKANIPFIVLDRPNPLGGVIMGGPVLEYPKYSSFIGLYPIPLQHGMTVGELALLFNDKYLSPKVKLSVIPMDNWQRTTLFDETGIPWVLPSPNLPTFNSAIVYPGQVILEGTNLSEGRGTTLPFEVFGAPWINGYELTKKLLALKLPGVLFRETWFTPTFSKFKGQLCRGAQLYVTDRKAYQPILTTLSMLALVRQMYGDKLAFHQHYFDHVMGTASVREALLRSEPVKDIVAAWQPGLDAFVKERKPFLLYE